MNDNTEYLKGLAEAETKRKQTKLDQQRAQALLDVQRTQETTMPKFTEQKQQASVQSQIGAKNFAEYWANRGQANAGITPAYEMSRQNALANQIGGITTDENAAMTGFNQNRADIGTNYTNALTNANNEINANLQANLYNEKLRQEAAQAKWEQEQYDRNITETKMQQDLDNEMFDRDLAIANFNNLGGGGSGGNPVVDDNKPKDGQTKRIGDVWYRGVNGKWVEVKVGTNPYTGTTNKDALNVTGKIDPTKTFSNGYQPNNVGGNKLSSTGVTAQVNGANQNVWKTTTTDKGRKLNPFDSKQVNTYYIWDGQSNKYVKLNSSEIKSLGLK